MFPKLEDFPNIGKFTKLKKGDDNIKKLRKRDTLDPQKESKDQESFQNQFEWPRSQLTAEQIQYMHEL